MNPTVDLERLRDFDHGGASWQISWPMMDRLRDRDFSDAELRSGLKRSYVNVMICCKLLFELKKGTMTLDQFDTLIEDVTKALRDKRVVTGEYNMSPNVLKCFVGFYKSDRFSTCLQLAATLMAINE
eukprot:gnl/Carplike_NY0171/7899_a10939_191.p1 GENE.gnl/Carplike_NY0171/7899_a10939_191~~gnl/Carplike_NY0171/7899_a10939_191.p1  ORF type:complete len:127 (+),score=16.40 gnl/Carplike_NY0171/7899_a10939_191:103-483(+)